MINVLVFSLCYLLGGFSVGYYLVHFTLKQDIRTLGSGATGATNTGRVLGKKGFILTLIGDAFKGGLAAGVVIFLDLSSFTVTLSLVAIVVGHIWPLQLGFRGGKGLAPFLGGLLVIHPWLTLTLIVLALAFLALTRRYTLSGLLTIALSPMVYLFFKQPRLQIWGMVVLAIIILFAHRENIRQITLHR